MYLLTSFLKITAKITTPFFYKRFRIEGREHVPKKGPLLVVSNHPNTVMDGMMIGITLYQKPFFLAKSTVFSTPLSRYVLSTIRCIPVYRAQDSTDGKADNSKMFAACYEKLNNHKTLLIFPEGTSYHERKLRKVKTGAARIALGAAAEKNFQLPVQILPIGLNYSDPRRFRSNLLIKIAPPIQMKDWQQAYEEDEQAAVRKLTEQIKNTIENQIIITENAKEDMLLANIEEVYKGQLLESLGWDKRDLKVDFKITKTIEEALQYFKQIDPARVTKWQHDLEAYMENLEQLRLKDNVVKEGASAALWTKLGRTFYFILGFPVYIYGMVQNYIPYILPSIIAYKITKEEEYIAPLLFLLGMTLFPIFYGLLAWGFGTWISSNFWWILAYLFSLGSSGLFTLSYWNAIQDSQARWNLFSLFKNKKTLAKELIQQRKAIIEDLEKARTEYSENLKLFGDGF